MDTFASAARIVSTLSALDVQCECQSLRKAIAIEEMAEGVKLVSDCDGQAIPNGRP